MEEAYNAEIAISSVKRFIELPNRIVMSPMTRLRAAEGGSSPRRRLWSAGTTRQRGLGRT